MATHTIGRGKVNIATTLTEVDAQLVGRAAFGAGMSRNQFCREALARALERASAADPVLRARIAASKAAKGAALLVTVMAVGAAIWSGEDLRRSGRTVYRGARVRREEAA